MSSDGLEGTKAAAVVGATWPSIRAHEYDGSTSAAAEEVAEKEDEAAAEEEEVEEEEVAAEVVVIVTEVARAG